MLVSSRLSYSTFYLYAVLISSFKSKKYAFAGNAFLNKIGMAFLKN